jgi:hypothetical protein
MWKLIFKYNLVLFMVLFSALNSYGQKNPFLRRWELAGVPASFKLFFQKEFNEKAEFVNTRTTREGAVVSHHGRYTAPFKIENPLITSLKR